MKIEQFTEKARQAVSEANELAKQYNNSQIEVEHLLAALLSQEGGVVQQVIPKVGGDSATWHWHNAWSMRILKICRVHLGAVNPASRHGYVSCSTRPGRK